MREPAQQRPTMAQVDRSLTSILRNLEAEGAEPRSQRAASASGSSTTPTLGSEPADPTQAHRIAAPKRIVRWPLLVAIACTGLAGALLSMRPGRRAPMHTAQRAPAAAAVHPPGAPLTVPPDMSPLDRPQPQAPAPLIGAPRPSPELRADWKTPRKTPPRGAPETRASPPVPSVRAAPAEKLRSQIRSSLRRATEACSGPSVNPLGCKSLAAYVSEFLQYQQAPPEIEVTPMLAQLLQTLCKTFQEKHWPECR